MTREAARQARTGDARSVGLILRIANKIDQHDVLRAARALLPYFDFGDFHRGIDDRTLHQPHGFWRGKVLDRPPRSPAPAWAVAIERGEPATPPWRQPWDAEMTIRELVAVEAIVEAVLAESREEDRWKLERLVDRAVYAHREACHAGFHVEDAERKQRERAGWESSEASLDPFLESETSLEGDEGVSITVYELGVPRVRPSFSITPRDIATEAVDFLLREKPGWLTETEWRYFHIRDVLVDNVLMTRQRASLYLGFKDGWGSRLESRLRPRVRESLEYLGQATFPTARELRRRTAQSLENKRRRKGELADRGYGQVALTRSAWFGSATMTPDWTAEFTTSTFPRLVTIHGRALPPWNRRDPRERETEEKLIAALERAGVLLQCDRREWGRVPRTRQETRTEESALVLGAGRRTERKSWFSAFAEGVYESPANRGENRRRFRPYELEGAKPKTTRTDFSIRLEDDFELLYAPTRPRHACRECGAQVACGGVLRCRECPIDSHERELIAA